MRRPPRAPHVRDQRPGRVGNAISARHQRQLRMFQRGRCAAYLCIRAAIRALGCMSRRLAAQSIGEGGGKHDFTDAWRRSGQVRWAWNRPLATGATGPLTHSRPSGPGRTSMVLGRPVNRLWWISKGSPEGRTPGASGSLPLARPRSQSRHPRSGQRYPRCVPPGGPGRARRRTSRRWRQATRRTGDG
jgi:hypothetical protein